MKCGAERRTRFSSMWWSGGSARSGRARTSVAATVCSEGEAVLGAHGAEAPQGMFWGFGARVGPCRLAPLLAMCCMMSMGPVPVETLVTVRSFAPDTSMSHTKLFYMTWRKLRVYATDPLLAPGGPDPLPSASRSPANQNHT